MKLKFLKSVLDSQDTVAKIRTIAFSPNNKKLAISTSDLNVVLFDEKFQKKDKFATKPVDSKFGKKSYLVTSLVFSPDSTKLAIGQTDNIVFVYKLGETWEEKKVICNKFTQSAPVTSLIWPEENRLIIGLTDGKVRYASVHSNKCSTIYKTETGVVSLAQSPNRRSFVSGHEDCSIILFSFETRTQAKICIHTCVPYCILLSNFGILASGEDKKIISYSEQGRILQEFDSGRDPEERGFNCAILDPFGYNAVFGSFDRLKLMSWSQRRGAWDEGQVMTIKNLYVITALAWKPDGSTIICGNITGLVLAIDCALKKSLIKNQFETTFVSPSQVVVRDINTDHRCVVRSEKGLSITDIRVMGKGNRYIVAYTSSTLVLVDRETEKSSEIPWESGGNEKFYFDNENVCMIINAGEISFIEYGRNEIAGWIRTERISPHLISVRLNERMKKEKEEIRRVAYMLDVHTISVVDLSTGNQISQIPHGNVVDWLELNETGTKLLFRDVRSSLFLFDFESEKIFNMINFCSYVQWVPKSDVVVAQSGDQLCIWYNTDHADQISQIPIQGDVEAVLRDKNRTEVIVQESNSKVAYELDSSMIEFETAINELDLPRATVYLEESEKENVEVGSMWRQLAQVALEQGQLLIAQRAFAGLKDISKVKFIEETIEISEEASKQIGGDGTQFYKVRARLALMQKNFKEAERIYLEQNSVQEAIDMYQKLHKWEEAIELAKATNYADLEGLKSRYYRNLYDTGQEEKAAEIKEKEGDPMSAVDLFLKSNQPAHAARILLDNEKYCNDENLVEKVGSALIQNEIYDKAGELFEASKQFQKALDSYRKGKNFGKSIQVARFSFPEEVVVLEEEWGDDLYQNGKFEAAISHFLESGKLSKAADSAIRSKEWEKALQILNVIDDQEVSGKFYKKIAEHYENSGDFEKAEKFYIESGNPKDAIEMYNRISKWPEAYKLASEFLGLEQTHEIYLQKAEELEQSGRFKEAEELYLSLGESTRAIAMYKESNKNEEMMRLVEKFHGDRVQETHKRLGEELEEKGDYAGAEEQYLLGGDWKSAVNMYKEAGQWAEAFRIAKVHGGERIPQHIAYMWAKSLGGDSAVKLLQRHGMLNEAIEIGMEKDEFDFVFELCRLGAKNKLPEVQSKYAERLEDGGEYPKAEEYYLLSGRAREAVLMYMHNQDWDSAERLAEENCKDVLEDVYIAQARSAMEKGEHEKVESYLLRANKADLIVKYYRDREMWQDALRVSKEFLPDSLPGLESEFENYQLKSGQKGAASFFVQARDWETQGEFRKAIETYLKIDESITPDTNLILQAHKHAGELVAKFMVGEEGAKILEKIGEKLVELNQGKEAGELLLLGNRPQAAIKALLEAKEWAKAKRVAQELAPEMESTVDEAYREFLKNQGRIGDLIDVDVISAIEILIERGNWEKALETAKQQNHAPLLDKYVAAYAAELISQERILEAVRVFEKYGASANPANFNIYKQLIDQILNSPDSEYESIAILRNMIHSLNENIMKSENHIDNQIVDIFNKYEFILHFSALQNALKSLNSPEIERLKLHISISLVRYVDLMQPDKIFFEAGVACRNFGDKYENLGFVFLNHYLDVVDAIEENDPSGVDNTIFEGTDIPLQFGLPNSMFLSEEIHEEIKEWVLSVSVDKKISKELPLDKRGVYEASTVDSEGKEYPICVISGYPIIGQIKELGNGKAADPANWQTFVTVAKTNPSDYLFDVQQFLGRWTNSHINFSL
ncbi:hypothetical protein FO519_004806 [Halicephalobus sp. NKZ332]|nr:hypothetical protein FO519_004806 [Halicephalobus sp. NKZ332]